MKQLKCGILITVEGIDGCGKTTFVKKLAELTAQLMPTLVTKEPGDNSYGPYIRTMLQEQPAPLDPKAEFLLFAADRAQHITQIVKPALANKKLVISDRLADASVVYQGYARGLDIDLIKRINTWALDGVTPFRTFFIRIDPQTAFERLLARKQPLTAFEKQCRDFMERVAAGYETHFAHQKHVITLDGRDTPDNLANQALQKLLEALEHESSYE